MSFLDTVRIVGENWERESFRLRQRSATVEINRLLYEHLNYVVIHTPTTAERLQWELDAQPAWRMNDPWRLLRGDKA